jgi:RimJ/RimL family protein N-acetyltransferase
MTGLGLGPIAIRQFLQRIVFADASVSAVIADPEAGNLRWLRALSKAGFSVIGTVQLTREDFQRRVVRLGRESLADQG